MMGCILGPGSGLSSGLGTGLGLGLGLGLQIDVQAQKQTVHLLQVMAVVRAFEDRVQLQFNFIILFNSIIVIHISKTKPWLFSRVVRCTLPKPEPLCVSTCARVCVHISPPTATVAHTHLRNHSCWAVDRMMSFE